MSAHSRTRLEYPSAATRIIEHPRSSMVQTCFGRSRCMSGYRGANILAIARLFLSPGVGLINPGLNAYVDLKGSFARSFSVLPLTRAHMLRPFSVLSVPAPDT